MENLMRSVDLKLKRAELQVNSLSDQIIKWNSSNPIKARCELREGRLGYRIVIEDIRDFQILSDWEILIGECIHNLRSALDNLAFALARIKKDPPENPKGISFPIYSGESEFRKSQGFRNFYQLPEDAALLLEKLQPFQRNNPDVDGTPDEDALITLQLLNNLDKHQLPSVVLINPQSINFDNGIAFYTEEDAAANVPPETIIFGSPLVVGSVVFEYKTKVPIKSVIGNYGTTVILKMKGINDLIEVELTLRQLHDYTKLIVAQFRRFFL